MKAQPTKDRLTAALDYAQTAAAFLRQVPQCLPEGSVAEKTCAQDLVTEWDRAVEQQLRTAILTDFPEDSVVGEEFDPSKSGASGYTWYLDPIDGTTNFINQRAHYAISIGCWKGNEPIAGVVCEVAADRVYWAGQQQPAQEGEMRLSPSKRTTLESALVTSPGLRYTFFDPHPHLSGSLAVMSQARAVRSLGCVALELAQLARGEVDAVLCLRSSPWDHAAGRILVESVGAVMSTLDGEPLPVDQPSAFVAAATPALHQALLTCLKRG